MYFWVAALGSLSLLKDNRLFNAIFVVVCLMFAQSSNDSFFIASDPRNAQLALLFFLGAFFYVNRNQITLGFLGLGILCALMFVTTEYRISGLLKATVFAYAVLLSALHPKMRLPSIDRWGDVSYGLYIYAFPVQQTIAHFVPQIRPLYMFVMSAPMTFILAIISWRLVESPAIKMKGKINLLFRRHIEEDVFTAIKRRNKLQNSIASDSQNNIKDIQDELGSIVASATVEKGH
jgi:peptidoglycan/LPS O-acetylase OafA/YrhL